MTDIIKTKTKSKIKGLLGKDTVVTKGKIKDTYGWLPKSVWDITKSKELKDLVRDNSMERYRDGNGKQPLSEFNPDVAMRCLQIWSEKCDYVLDPFMNRGTTSIIAAYYGRYGYANEIVKSYYDGVKERVNTLIEEGKEWAEDVFLNHGDARDIVKIADKEWGVLQFDYIYTSPPYWNVEKYESTNGQLSDMDDYALFIEEYTKIMEQLYHVLKPQKYMTLVVNDFRRNGEFIWFSGDTIMACQRVGFELHDIVINVIRTPYVSGVEKAVEKFKRTIKYHEYVLTFKKV